jgi:hypothetical protein
MPIEHRPSETRLPLCPDCGGEYDGFCILCERERIRVHEDSLRSGVASLAGSDAGERVGLAVEMPTLPCPEG